MIKYKKSELQNMLRALQETCNDAVQGFEPDELSYAMAQAQGLAYNMGTNIEKYHKGGEEIVRMLESYCEYAYNLAADAEDVRRAKRLLKKMDKLLVEIELKIKYKLPDDKPEIVFFPYKASMWDCMESVWAAAKKDESFDVFVVPIPYYKKNEKGELKELCYEGGDFPPYVELTYFEDYNTKNRRPDIIYVHNPYDDVNIVTSVHPDYYLLELRKYTDMLVYIPYYLTDETDRIIEDEGIERLTTPGIRLSTCVIVQSEKVKAAFVESVDGLQNTKDKEELKNILRQKLLPLGSPKLDKAFSLSKADAVFTEEIKAKLYNMNGSRKPIILYNTSIYQFLLHRDILINKISNVLNYYSNMDEYLLWWRPHPLLLASIRSMLPELLNEYEELIAMAKSSESIIYDDSSDLYTALAAADVYYGDANSIAELYKMTGGAVFVTNNANCGIELMAEQLLKLKGEDRKSSYVMAGPEIHRDICERLGL